MDLKTACAKYLIEYLKPVRDYFSGKKDVLEILG